MNILFLISQIPYPLDTGAKIRSFNLIRQLSAKHKITLVTFRSESKENFKLDALKAYCKDIITLPKKTEAKYLNLFLNIFSPLPYTVKKYFAGSIEKTIRDLVATGAYDVIHCDSLQMSLNLRKTNTLPKVLTEHNVESAIMKRYAHNESNILKKMYIGMQSTKLASYEFDACKRFNRCIAVSEEDKGLILKHSGINDVSVVPNGVDCEYFSSRSVAARPCSLVFTGSLDWIPNEDGLIYFFSKIYPLVKRRMRHANITIIGRSPSAKLRRLTSKDDSIRLIGLVDDVRPYIAQSEVFIVPLRIGGGTRLKILEAMAMGRPVVSTSIGAEGLGVKDGDNIILADTPKEFAERIFDLFENSKKRESITKAGRRLVEEKYDWSKIAGKLEQAWQSVA